MNKKIDISSTAIEKGIDLAKDFLDKLIAPAIEETGLLLKDKVTLWKFRNQVKMLNKAKAYCEKNNVTPKVVSLKLLCPLLDNAALEEDEVLQDKWAILLSNLVDSDQNIENHVFPYILGQISTNEYMLLEKVFFDKIQRIKKLKIELEEFKTNRPKIEKELSDKVEEADKLIEKKKELDKSPFNNKVLELTKQKIELEWKISSLKYQEISIKRKISEPETVPIDNLREFELSNLIRLGLVKYVQETYAGTHSLEIPNSPDKEYLNVDFEIDLEVDSSHILTELGELFIDICTEKYKKTAPNKVLKTSGRGVAERKKMQ